jgi:hypothetical protein
MKRDTDARVRERERGLQRVRRVSRAVLAAAAGGCLAFAGLAAVSKSAHATGVRTGTAATTRATSTPKARTRATSTRKATTTQTTTATPTIAAPTFTPTPTPAAPVTSSGGS